jgi:hypothetical protein
LRRAAPYHFCGDQFLKTSAAGGCLMSAFRSAADFVRYVTKNLNRIHPPHSGNVRRPIPPNQRMPAFRGAFQGGIERGIYEVERGKHLVERPFSIFRERKNEGPPFADSTVGARPAVTKIQILDHARHPPRGILAAVLEHPSPRQPAPHRAPRTHPEADNSPRQFPAFLGASPWGLVTSRQTFVRRRHSTPMRRGSLGRLSDQ